jgi:hypothetical protein
MRFRQSPLLSQVSICKQRILWFCLEGRKSAWFPSVLSWADDSPPLDGEGPHEGLGGLPEPGGHVFVQRVLGHLRFSDGSAYQG